MARMSFCSAFLFLLTITSWFAPRLADDAVPLLMWVNSECPDANWAVDPVTKVTTEEFDTILSCSIKKTPRAVVVYVKEDFCSEHIMPNAEVLKKIMPGEAVRYLPAVQQPLRVLRELPYYNHTNDEDTDNAVEGQILFKRIKTIDDFYKHYESLKEFNTRLVPILTGERCAYRDSDRVKREVQEETMEFIIRTDRVLLYSSQPLSIKVAEDKEFVPVPLRPIANHTDGAGTVESPLVLRLVFSGTEVSLGKYALEFNFVTETAGYHTLTAINYKPDNTSSNLLVSKSNIVFPYGFSYHCAQKMMFRKDAIHLNITNLQVQINGTSFGDAYDCVGFTSIPIWTGIFVTSILAVIMIWALTMIIDIRTMDRFDDPKGKTITIFAQE
ncbi:hypothetical protein KM043_003243 [Ampulex compressa]|nr:hypothetical protein KM043_003243 [Ampulex compressa]